MPYETGKDATPSLALGEIGRAITPDDTNDIVPYPRSVYVGVAGNVRFLPVKNVDGAYLTLVRGGRDNSLEGPSCPQAPDARSPGRPRRVGRR